MSYREKQLKIERGKAVTLLLGVNERFSAINESSLLQVSLDLTLYPTVLSTYHNADKRPDINTLTADQV
jgi:hypothetical protein